MTDSINITTSPDINKHGIYIHPYYEKYINNYLMLIRNKNKYLAAIDYIKRIQIGMVPVIYNDLFFDNIIDWLPDNFRPCNTIFGAMDTENAYHISESPDIDMDRHGKYRYTKITEILSDFPKNKQMYACSINECVKAEIRTSNIDYIVASSILPPMQCFPQYSNSYGYPIEAITVDNMIINQWKFMCNSL